MQRKTTTMGSLHCSGLLAALDQAMPPTSDSPPPPDQTAGEATSAVAGAADFVGTELPVAAILRSQFQVMELKRLYRQGWLKRGIDRDQTESVADHVFGTALLCLLLAGRPPFESLDAGKALRLALIHELGEVYTGDITPVDGVSLAEKHQRERHSLERVLGELPQADELRALWLDFETSGSPEARFVRQLDRLEMGLQAVAYKLNGSERMAEFFDSADRAVSDPALRQLLALALRVAE
ncbi:MAG TPA: phosphodiesterase [Spirochaetaceae bacterium]|nr:phosphodiesterase [Spirochaetaceae bacterium]